MAIAGLIFALAAAPPPTFDSEAAYEMLKRQVAFGPRVPGTAAWAKTRDLILAETRRNADSAELQTFERTWSRTGKPVAMANVIGYQNWAEAKTRVVLLAHWDSRPSAEQEPIAENRGKAIPGANDGASGVAVLLELMRVLKTQAPKELGIQYLFTDGEDLGPGLDEMFLGAKYYSKNLPKVRPDYGVLLDMIGDKDLEVPIEPNSYARAKGPTTAIYRYAAKIGLGKTFPSKFGPEILDDHLALNDAGIPTLDLIDFSYEPWHTLGDTPDKTSAASLGKVGLLLESFLTQPRPYAPNPR